MKLNNKIKFSPQTIKVGKKALIITSVIAIVVLCTG